MRKGNLQAQAAVLCDFMSQFRHPYELTPASILVHLAN